MWRRSQISCCPEITGASMFQCIGALSPAARNCLSEAAHFATRRRNGNGTKSSPTSCRKARSGRNSRMMDVCRSPNGLSSLVNDTVRALTPTVHASSAPSELDDDSHVATASGAPKGIMGYQHAATSTFVDHCERLPAVRSGIRHLQITRRSPRSGRPPHAVVIKKSRTAGIKAINIAGL